MNCLAEYLQLKEIPMGKLRKIEHHLSMESSELQNLTIEQLEAIFFDLNAYNFYLQRFYNEQLAKAEKCRAEIDRIVAHTLPNYENIFGTEYRWMAAVNENEAARHWKDMEINIRAVVTSTTSLAQRVDNLAKCVDGIVRRRTYGKN